MSTPFKDEIEKLPEGKQRDSMELVYEMMIERGHDPEDPEIWQQFTGVIGDAVQSVKFYDSVVREKQKKPEFDPWDDESMYGGGPYEHD